MDEAITDTLLAEQLLQPAPFRSGLRSQATGHGRGRIGLAWVLAFCGARFRCGGVLRPGPAWPPRRRHPAARPSRAQRYSAWEPRRWRRATCGHLCIALASKGPLGEARIPWPVPSAWSSARPAAEPEPYVAGMVGELCISGTSSPVTTFPLGPHSYTVPTAQAHVHTRSPMSRRRASTDADQAGSPGGADAHRARRPSASRRLLDQPSTCSSAGVDGGRCRRFPAAGPTSRRRPIFASGRSPDRGGRAPARARPARPRATRLPASPPWLRSTASWWPPVPPTPAHRRGR